MDELSYDVVIIGAGPAGCSAALRLLQLGYSVAIIERTAFKREQIGESLTAGIWNILDYLNINHCLQRQEYVTGCGSNVWWQTQRPEHIPEKHRGRSIIVNRGIFDSDLLSACKKRGAHVFQPATIIDQIKTAQGWHLKINIKELNARQANVRGVGGETHQLTLQAGCIFDAKGRIPKKIKIATAPSSIALWADLDDRHSKASLPRPVSIEALENGWIWSAPLASDRFRVMLFMDKQEYQALLKQNGRMQVMQYGLAKSVMHKAIRLSDSNQLHVCENQPGFNCRGWSEDYIYVGASALVLDPLSSTGVEKAMRFSLQAVTAFHTAQGDKDSQSVAGSFYREKLLDAAVNHSQWGQGYYAQAQSRLQSNSSQSVFWQTRSCFFSEGVKHVQYHTTSDSMVSDYVQSMQKEVLATPSPPALSVSAIQKFAKGKQFYLSPQVIFESQLAVFDDRVIKKRCIRHPALPAPTAYLSEVDIIPLLESLPDSSTFEYIHEYWSRIIDPRKALKVLVYCVGVGILELFEACNFECVKNAVECPQD